LEEVIVIGQITELPSIMLIRRYKQFLDNATTNTDVVKYFCL